MEQYNESYSYDRMGNITTRTVSGMTQTYAYGCPPPSIAPTLPPTLPHRVYFPLVMKGYGPESPPMAACVAPFAVVSTTAGFRAAYDPNGNMVLRVEVSGTQRITYTQAWDAENRLAVVTNTVTGQVTRFVYDGDGNRILRIDDGGTTVYIGDYYERQGSTVRKYYYAGGQRVAMRVNGALYFLHTDHLGSTTLLTDPSGQAVARQGYWPYGDSRYAIGAPPTSRRYTGQRWDEALGLYDYRARYYHPALGRFISADPLVPEPGNPEALNRYAYALNNPVRYNDPSGHWIETAFDLISLGMTLNDIRNEGFTFWNTVSLATDVASIVLPAVPAGVSHAIRAAKWANRAINTADTVHDIANIADAVADVEKAAEIGVIARLRGTLDPDDFGHMAVYTKIGDDVQVRGFYPQEEYYSANLFASAVPGRVENDFEMLRQVGMSGVVQASRGVPVETAQRLRAALGEPGPRPYLYSFNPDDFANAYNCVTWACSMVNQVVPSSPLPVVRQGRIKLAVPALLQLPPPWRVAGKIPE